MALKDNWKDAGVGFGHAFRDLGKAFANTAKTTIHKMDEWANGEDEKKRAEKEPESATGEQTEEAATEPAAEEESK